MANWQLPVERFTAQLPAAYYLDRLEFATAADIWNIEVTGLADDGEFMLELSVDASCKRLNISIDHSAFTACCITDGMVRLPAAVVNEHLMFDVHCPDAASCPVTNIILRDVSCPDAPVQTFDTYTRDINLDPCNLLQDWPATQKRIMAEDFDLADLAVMRDELIDFSASRQVLDVDDPHYGAIYSDEDKYSFTDAIYAALAFWRRFERTNDPQWQARALIARDYCFKGQYRNTGDPGADGAWTSMGIIDTPEGKGFRRITDKWSWGSGVDTCLICTAVWRLWSAGMPFESEHLDQLRATANWQQRNWVAPGWFSHHQHMELTCLNVNSLAAGAIASVHTVLTGCGQTGLSETLLHHAAIGYHHVLNCQEAIGVFPYRRGDNKRGGAYSLENLPDNGIGLTHQLPFIQMPCSPLSLDRLAAPMRRSALWYLLCSRWDDAGHLILEADDDPTYCSGLAFGNFTWCRITMSDIISQLWDTIGDRDFWRQFVRSHLRTIRQCYWNTDDPTRSPLKPTVVPDIKLVSWQQQTQWAAVIFDMLIDRYDV